MIKYESFWSSNWDWVKFTEKGMTIREDAPPEAQESYRIHKQQIKERKEREERLKEDERRGNISNH